MLDKFKIIIGVLCCSLLAGSILAGSVEASEQTNKNRQQYYKSSDLIKTAASNVDHGRGELTGQMAFLQNDAAADDAIKEIGIMSLNRGNYIGMHQLDDNEEIYVVMSGTGLYSNGINERIIGKGDIAIARPGQRQSLRNIGYEPLIFLRVLAHNDAIYTSGKGSTEAKPLPIVNTSFETKKQAEQDRRAKVEISREEARQRVENERQQKKADAQQAKENAKKAKEAEQLRKKKAREDMKIQREIQRENERLTRAKARRDAKTPMTADRREREAELRAAKAEEAAWEERQKNKVRAENPKELDDEFAIGIK